MSGAAEARGVLQAIGAAPDAPIELAEAALALSAVARPGLDLPRYRAKLAAIADAVRPRAAWAEAVDTRRRLINEVLFDEMGFRGDSETYDDLGNADLAEVLDSRKGLPVALGILYIAAARAQGWDASGLALPGHFLIRLESGGVRMIVDPFARGAARGAADLRDLLKLAAGLGAELAPEHYAPVPDRDVLLRLQNNLKVRHIGAGRIEDALGVIETMLLIAPDQPGLWQEAGLLQARLGLLAAAAESMEACVARCRTDDGRNEAAALLRRIRDRLN